MEDGRKMICDRCRASVPISEMQYLPKGKDSMTALCPQCRKASGMLDAKKAAQAKTNKQPFFCARCKYHFEFDVTGVTNFICPYCGKGDKVTSNKIGSADELLHSLNDNFLI